MLFFCILREYSFYPSFIREEMSMKLMEIFDVPTQETHIPVPYVIAEAGVNH